MRFRIAIGWIIVVIITCAVITLRAQLKSEPRPALVTVPSVPYSCAGEYQETITLRGDHSHEYLCQKTGNDVYRCQYHRKGRR
jgi:hypothetical protein